MRRLNMESERGAVAVFTALFLTGVLLAVGLVTIDVGRIYSERRQLQNGADAAALAVAQSCAKGSCDTTLAVSYANGNANDGSAALAEPVCGTFAGLPACGTQSGSELTKCPEASSGAHYVRVRTRTEGETGSVIKSLFGGPDKTIGACALVSASGVKLAEATVPLTIGVCKWKSMTHDGAGPYPTAEVELDVDKNQCEGSPGDFGWLDGFKDDCSAILPAPDADGWVESDTGVVKGQMGPCEDILDPKIAAKQPIFVPVFDDYNGHAYHLLGWAAFVPTRYSLQTSYPAGTVCHPNTGPNKVNACIYGKFTQALVPNPTAVGGPDLGAIGIGLTG